MSMKSYLHFAVLFCLATSYIHAQFAPCTPTWQTVKTDGTAYQYTDTNFGTTCIKTAPYSCQDGPNPQCSYSFRTNRYICCYDVWLAVGGLDILTANGTSKPFCPNGALAYGDNQPLTCDPTKPNSCTTGYTCTRSWNASTNAARNPNVCCKTSTLNSFAAVWSQLGLTPTIVPVAPAQPIVSIIFGTATAALFIHQGDDWSQSTMKAKFLGSKTAGTKLLPSGILLPNNVSTANTDYYHLLVFDAVNNKHILAFMPDMIPKAGNYFELAPTAANTIIVYPSGTKNATYSGYLFDKDYLYGPGDYPTPYTTRQTYVALLFHTSVKKIADLNITLTAGGTFDPNYGTLYNTTVTDFLKSGNSNLFGKGLGPPIAGTYFYI
uniref:Uncharacterized protein n=1 Tax=Plectus sambesii TaxID=2011161 RepID=A0A914WM91_9BILA